MYSSITNAPFSTKGQEALRSSASSKGYKSPYWLTMPQALRSCNAIVLPGEAPTTVYLHVQKVVPVARLSRQAQKRLLDEHPPFFGSGVGILSERHKWRLVTAERLIRLLNKTDEERALFIDVDLSEELNIKYSPKDVIDVRSASNVEVFNADQLDDPYKGEPQRGIALNAITGKRIGQPAHDILLAVGIMRGYTSPMWVFKDQMPYLNLELRPRAVSEGVDVPDMRGPIAPLTALPAACQKQLLAELRKQRPEALNGNLFHIYNINRWELSRSRVLVQQMAAIASMMTDNPYPFLFVNLWDLALRRPEYIEFVNLLVKKYTPLLSESMYFERKTHALKTREELIEQHGGSNSSGFLVQQARLAYGRFPFFFAEDATLRRFYNAACATQPHLVMPSTRPIAIVNGRLLGHRDESVLRAFSLKHKLSSPLWLTPAHAHRLGVGIPARNRHKYVTIGPEATEQNPEIENSEGFYNISDFADPEEVLSIFPKASRSVHFMLDAKWRPVLGKNRQDYLTSLGKPSPLWVSVNECLMSGFQPIAGRPALNFPRKMRGAKGGGGGGSKLYNSQYTTDPVRCIGLATMLVRTATNF